MHDSVSKVTEGLAPRPIPSQRERRRRGEEEAFRLPADEQPLPTPEQPLPRTPEHDARPVAAPEEGEPGAHLDLRA